MPISRSAPLTKTKKSAKSAKAAESKPSETRPARKILAPTPDVAREPFLKGERGDKGECGDKGERGDPGLGIVLFPAARRPIGDASLVFYLDELSLPAKNKAGPGELTSEDPSGLLLGDTSLFSRGTCAMRVRGSSPTQGLVGDVFADLRAGVTLSAVFEPSEMVPDVRWITELVGTSDEGQPNAVSLAFFPGRLRAQIILGRGRGEIAQFTTSVPWTLGRRTLFGLRYDPATERLDAFLNGFLESTTAARGLFGSAMRKIGIGRAVHPGPASWKGTIAEVRLTPQPEPDEYFAETARTIGLL